MNEENNTVEFEQSYNYNNLLYKIFTTSDVHYRLQTDQEFFNKYLAEIATSYKTICITEQEKEKFKNFVWTKQNTKLLLQKYFEKKDMFRDPKIKKKSLWAEIVTEFKLKNYNVTEDILDRKMRNLKQSYRSLKDNNKKTGRGTISWEWYEIMEDIFKEDKTINISATLSSMEYSGKRIDTKRTNSSIPSTSTCEVVQISNSSSDIEITEDSRENKPSLSTFSDATISQPSLKDIKEQKATRSKTLYHMRKKELESDEKRLDTLNGIKRVLENFSDIQKERNEIFKKMLLSLTEETNSPSMKVNPSADDV